MRRVSVTAEEVVVKADEVAVKANDVALEVAVGNVEPVAVMAAAVMSSALTALEAAAV